MSPVFTRQWWFLTWFLSVNPMFMCLPQVCSQVVEGLPSPIHFQDPEEHPTYSTGMHVLRATSGPNAPSAGGHISWRA